jgi:hypothetical protein
VRSVDEEDFAPALFFLLPARAQVGRLRNQLAFAGDSATLRNFMPRLGHKVAASTGA